MQTIQIYGDIGGCPWDDDCVTQESFLEQYQAAGSGDIRVEINTRGGSFSVGLFIYNTLAAHPGKVTTINMGIAASMGLLLLQAGSERLTAPATISMMHKAQDCCYDQMDADDALEIAAKLSEFDKILIQIYSQKTGKNAAEINKALSGDGSWFEAQSLIDFGLADRIDQKIMPVDISNQIARMVKNHAKLPAFVTNKLHPKSEEIPMTPEQQDQLAVKVGNSVTEALKPLIDALAVKNAAPEHEPAPVVDVAAEIKNAMAEVNAPLVAVLQQLAATPHNKTAIPATFGAEGFVHEGELR